ncbi:MAG: hypothetical protein CL853_05110 [Crocinitomicaceae bacterium]|nr:hypothetical protein [Crocinitomicaceae bacterium]
MKKSSILISSLLLIPLGAFFLIGNFSENSSSEPTYKSVTISKKSSKSKSWNDAADLYHSLYQDESTGQIDYQQLKLAKQEVLSMMLNKAGAFTFVEEGPDNVGGRTRGIAIDPSDDNIIYAGSVTGGLFKTENAGNSWSRVDAFDLAVNDAISGNGSISISSITITVNGTIYVATGGSVFEGSLAFEGSGVTSGDGIWYSTNDGASFEQLLGTSGQDVTKVVSDYNQDDVIYYSGSSLGVKKVVDGGTPTSVTGVPTATTGDVKVSLDGQVIITGVSQGGQRTWISQDGGSNWTDLHSNGQLTGSGAGRSEYAISPFKNANGHYTLYVCFVTSSGALKGVYRSIDNGTNWCQIGPGATTGFAPFGDNTQGLYDCVIASHPTQDGCILGGIDLWKWTQTPGGTCDNGQWEIVSSWGSPLTSPFYIHADNHRITFNSQGRMYVGNDGGVQMAAIPNTTNGPYTVVNKGYNITQFYGIAYGGYGEVMGGSQDNGTQFNDKSGVSPLEFREVMGGDGFECEISYLSSDAIISTIYNGQVYRSDDAGLNWQAANAPCSSQPGLGSGCGPFYNSVRLFEDANDLNTKDSVEYIPLTSMQIGDSVTYYSASFEIPMQHILTQNLTVSYDTVIPLNDSVLPNFDTIPAGVPYLYNPVAQDTINLPDYKQSLFATQGEANIYITRDMMRFGVTPEWWKLFSLGAPFMNSSARSYDFSKDGNWLWIGSSNGEIIRVSGLDSAYSIKAASRDYRPNSNSVVALDTVIQLSTGDTITGSALDNINYDVDGHDYINTDGSPVEYQLHIIKISNSFGGVITDISVDPSNPNNVCVVTGGSSGTQVWYSTNGGSTSPTFSSIDGNLPNMPVFGCVLEKDPSTDVVVIGTEYGVFSATIPTSGSVSWTPHNEEVGPVPVFDVRQQWRDYEEGILTNDVFNKYQAVRNPGSIYLGTHARGIWRSDDVLSTQEINPIENSENIILDRLEVFPNPMVDEGRVSFELGIMSDVTFTIYDLQGKTIETILWKNMMSGTHTMDFDCSDFPVGTYFAVVESSGFNKVAKFVKY